MKIAIAGAGISGLAAATWLKRKGHEVILYEAATRAGGRSQTIKRPNSNDIIDVGTQYFHSNYKRTFALIKASGLKAELHKVSGKTRFFDARIKKGTFVTGHRFPYIASGSLFANLRMFFTGAFQLAQHPIDPFSVLRTSKIDTINAGEAITDPFEWEYNARALISAGALIEPQPNDVSYLHLIRLMRIIVTTDYFTLNGGIASLHAKLAEAHEIHYDAPVASLLVDQAKICGLKLRSGGTVEADRVIVATTPAAAAQLLPAEWVEEVAFLKQIKQPPAVVVSLFLDRKLENKIWSYVFRPKPDRLVSFCVDTSQKNPQMAPSGKAVLQAWICHPAADKVLALSDEKIKQLVVEELAADFASLPDLLEGFHIHKVVNAIPQTPVGHNQRAQQFLDLMDAHHGIEMCGDYMSGGYLECALWSAERAVNKMT